MAVGSCDIHRQRCAALIDQDMDFAPAFATLRRVLARLGTAQGCRTTFTVNRLPLDLPLFRVELHPNPQELVKKTLLLPGLEAFMQGTTAYSKPALCTTFHWQPVHNTYQMPFNTARLSAGGRPGPRFFGALGSTFFILRHIGRGTRK
jgi:hypothetical protein